MKNTKQTLAATALAITLALPGCANLFQKGKPVQNAHTAIRLGSVAWHQYVGIEKMRCGNDQPCLARLVERNEKAQEVILMARGHVKALDAAIKAGEKVKAGQYIDALEELVMGLDPKHFQDTFDVLGSLRRKVAEMMQE